MRPSWREVQGNSSAPAAHVPLAKPQPAASLLDVKRGPGKSTSQLHSEVIFSGSGRIMRCTKVLGK